MSDAANPAALVLWGGFAIAFVFGIVASKNHFCVMGSVSDVVNMGDWMRMRTWLLAIAVAAIGANLLHYAGLIDLSRSVYQRPVLPWLSLLLGGAVFGVGMTLAGGCPNRNLIRLGGGSVRSLVVLVFVAVAAYMTLKGLFGQWRSSYLDPVAVDLSSMGLTSQSMAGVLAKLTGMAGPTALLVTLGVVGLVLLAFIFSDKEFRRDRGHVAAAAVLGLLIVAGWYLTGNLGYAENPDTLEDVYFATNTRTLESLTFVGPMAYSLELLMLWTDKSLHATFGIVSVLGVVSGALVVALATQRFHWEGFASLQDLRNNLSGAVLMGVGGVTAFGCTIGQGMSGLSTLAMGSVIAVAGIVAGSAATMKWLQR